MDKIPDTTSYNKRNSVSQPSQCRGDRACIHPPVKDGLCASHYRDSQLQHSPFQTTASLCFSNGENPFRRERGRC
jgi:hypothetical protein